MKLDGTLESWDELSALKLQVSSGRVIQKFPDGNADVHDLLECIRESLIDYQHWFIVPGPDPFYIEMPFAWYLDEGMQILNKNTGDIYTVTRKAPINCFKSKDISGAGLYLKGSKAPLEGEKLEFVNDSNRIVFKESTTDTIGEKYEVTSVGEKEVQKSWTDTITFFLTRREPAGLNEPFGRAKQVKAQVRREFISIEGDDRFVTSFRDQFFDNIYQFDCWSRTVRDANRLISWFEQFMFLYTWVWKLNCLGDRGEILYWQRTQDQVVGKFGQDLVRRPIRYYFKTMKAYYGISRKLSTLNKNFEVNQASMVKTPGAIQPKQPDKKTPVLTKLNENVHIQPKGFQQV